MRKLFIPILTSLALCGSATTALFVIDARAQNSARKPAMVLAQNDTMMAQNSTMTPPDGRALGGMRKHNPTDFAAHMKQRCDDRYARQVGRMAYLETRLELTPAEQPLFARWKEVKLGIAKRHEDECAKHVGRQDRARPSPVEHMGREEERLKRRVANLDAERPVFSELYNALTPEQRQSLLPHGHGMMHRSMMQPRTMEGGGHT